MIGGGKGYENGKGGGHQHLHPCVVQYGDCNFGTDCRFAQVDGRICAKFLKGNCAWGASCRWKHAHPAEGVAPAPRRRQGSGTSPTRGMRGWEEENQWLAGGGGGEEADQLLSQMQGGLPLASPLAGGLQGVDQLVSLLQSHAGGSPPPALCHSGGIGGGLAPPDTVAPWLQQAQAPQQPLVLEAMERVRALEERWNERIVNLCHIVLRNNAERQRENQNIQRNLISLMNAVKELDKQLNMLQSVNAGGDVGKIQPDT
eukprot:Hpha_TRINITY_DN16326_c2_g2::TRINITY_DN16326_c2_g2_i1::g.60223::m.60223